MTTPPTVDITELDCLSRAEVDREGELIVRIRESHPSSARNRVFVQAAHARSHDQPTTTAIARSA